MSLSATNASSLLSTEKNATAHKVEVNPVSGSNDTPNSMLSGTQKILTPQLFEQLQKNQSSLCSAGASRSKCIYDNCFGVAGLVGGVYLSVLILEAACGKDMKDCNEFALAGLPLLEAVVMVCGTCVGFLAGRILYYGVSSAAKLVSNSCLPGTRTYTQMDSV